MTGVSTAVTACWPAPARVTYNEVKGEGSIWRHCLIGSQVRTGLIIISIVGCNGISEGDATRSEFRKGLFSCLEKTRSILRTHCFIIIFITITITMDIKERERERESIIVLKT